jgi:CheY-like chemotaxis protein
MMRHRGQAAVEILLVEDSPTDALLAREAIDLLATDSNLSIVKDGVEAMLFLRKEGSFARAPRPTIIFLDLNLPRKDGREVLAEVKNDSDLQTIPVVILTTSRNEADVRTAYRSHANCYVVKPLDFEQFAEVMVAIEQFWFNRVTLPGRE